MEFIRVSNIVVSVIAITDTTIFDTLINSTDTIYTDTTLYDTTLLEVIDLEIGDIFHIEIDRPFSISDVYSFTTVPSSVDASRCINARRNRSKTIHI